MATNAEKVTYLESEDYYTPLTDWENEPSIRDLKKDYEAARSDHDSHTTKVCRWLDNLNVTGSARIKKLKGRSTIVPKLIRKQAEWRYAALSEPFLSQENIFKASPRSWKDKEAAYQNALVLNYQFNTQLDKVRFIDEYVRTAVDEGTAVIRVGWEFEEDENNKTVVNQPTVEVCDYNNVIIDPTCGGDLGKAGFVIYRFETSLTELNKAGIYQNLENIDIERNSILSEPDNADGDVKSFNFDDEPRKRIVAYEYWGYWDINNDGKTKPFVATWIGDTLIRMEESPFSDGKLPFVLVQYLPKRGEIYGEPDGELLEDNQKILGAVTRGMIDIMGRSAAGQKAIRVDALDVTNRRKFEAGEDYEFQAHVDPRQAFYDHVYPEIPASAQNMVQMQQLEAESLTGVKAFHQGLSGDALGQTATGARGAMDAAGKRELGIIRRLAEGLKEVGYKIVAMNGEFLSDEEIIRITDEEFVTINRENLQGRFDLKLDISSAELDNMKAQELAFMLQTMGNNMPMEMSQIVLADIARLRKMPELAKRIREYKPDNTMQQQLQQLQMMKLQAEIAKLQGEARNEQASGMLDQAKAQTEMMKARHLGAQADILDLDFLEEQQGVKHMRDMQKQGGQAMANMAMKERDAQNQMAIHERDAVNKDRNTLLNALATNQNRPRAPSASR